MSGINVTIRIPTEPEFWLFLAGLLMFCMWLVMNGWSRMVSARIYILLRILASGSSRTGKSPS